MKEAKKCLADFTHPCSCERRFKIPHCLVLDTRIIAMTGMQKFSLLHIKIDTDMDMDNNNDTDKDIDR